MRFLYSLMMSREVLRLKREEEEENGEPQGDLERDVSGHSVMYSAFEACVCFGICACAVEHQDVCDGIRA